MKYVLTSIICVFLSKSVWSQTPTTEYSFINKKYNYIQYKDSKAFKNLLDKWKNDSIQSICIAHFGDSHVQPDVFTDMVRKELQKQKGNAGRGMIFPYSIAKTYSQIDYSSKFSGNWKTANSIQSPPKLPLGVSGFVARTSDNVASFSIIFKKKLDKSEKVIKIFTDKCNYNLKISSKNFIKIIALDTIQATKPYTEVYFPFLGDTINFVIDNNNNNNNNSDESIFNIYGLSIENINKGVLYHNLGVGGANFKALYYQKYFDKQFPFLNADLVVLDWGTNDIIYTNQIDKKLQKTIVLAIKKIKEVSPNTAIMLVSPQDMNYRNKNVSVGKILSEMLRKIAFENECLFYDWYQVAGGNNSMKIWHSRQLAQKDNIHLTIKGAKFKGSLFAHSYLNTFEFLSKQSSDSLILKNDNRLLLDTLNIDKIIHHTVLKGETLFSISKKYNVTILSIYQINKLESEIIKEGDVLVIK